MGNRIGKVTRKIGAGVDRVSAKFRKLGKTIGPALGVAGVTGALLAVKMAIGAVVTKGAEFEQSLVSAGVRFEDKILRGTAAFTELEDAARLAGRTTEFTANESALALKFMAKAGFDAAFAIKALPSLVDLATASEQDLARASDIVSDSMAAFGMITGDNVQDLKNLTRVSDQMVKATNSANLSFEDMFETIKLGAPLAIAAGIPMEELIAITARMAQSGIKGSRGGTVINQMFTKLADPSVQKKLLRGLGIDIKDADKNLRPFAEVLDDLFDSVEKLSKLEQAGVMSQIFDVRGGRGILSFFTQGSGALKDLRNRLVEVKGETAKMAAVMRDTTKGALKELTSAWGSLQLSIFKANDQQEPFIDSMTRLVRAADAFVIANPGISKLLGLVVAVGGAFLLVGVAIAAIGAAIVFIKGSVVALVLAIGGAAVAFLAWIDIIGIIKVIWAEISFHIGRAITLLQKAGPLFDAFGFGDGDEDDSRTERQPDTIGQADRIAREMRESISTNRVDLRIKDETGRAVVDGPARIPGFGLTLEPTGAL